MTNSCNWKSHWILNVNWKYNVPRDAKYVTKMIKNTFLIFWFSVILFLASACKTISKFLGHPFHFFMIGSEAHSCNFKLKLRMWAMNFVLRNFVKSLQRLYSWQYIGFIELAQVLQGQFQFYYFSWIKEQHMIEKNKKWGFQQIKKYSQFH